MVSSPSWPPGLVDRLGPLEAVGSLGGGALRCRTALGDAVVKSSPGALDEADGLGRLRAAGGVRVPDVLATGPGWLATRWIPAGTRTPGSGEDLGRGLAALHRAPAPGWGGGSSWIGACRVDPAPADGPSEFYGRRLLGLAARCDLVAEVAPVVDRLPELVPPGPPAVLHGDLWWGNVLFGRHGEAWLIDPSVHGGHPEEDLAMLALFGPVPDRLLRAYSEVRPLAAGWKERVALWQLYPLLVHTVLFGGSYRSAATATATARRYA